MTRPEDPLGRDRLLLRAALLEGPAAGDAWRGWRSGSALSRLPPHLRGLMPLLHRNRTHLEVTEAESGELAQAYQTTLYRNRLLFDHAVRVLRALQKAGIETVLLKGAALVLSHYRDPGLRPMSDLDVLVRLGDAPAAFERLRELGLASPQRVDPLSLVARHSAPFAGGVAAPIDLHWRLFEECSWPGADDAAWDGSARAELAGVATRVLAPTDQLIHVLAHGARWSQSGVPRWIPDAATIIGTASIDWDLLANRAARLRLGLPLEQTLSALRELVEVPIPPEVLAELAAQPTSLIDRLRHRARSFPPDQRGPVAALALHYAEYRRLTRDAGMRPGPRSFILTVAREWGVSGVGPVLREAIPRGVRRVRRGVASRLSPRG